ncbi:MAG: MFS transporter [Halobacteriales archaeon]
MSRPATAAQRPLALLGNPEFVALTSVRFVAGMAFATIIIALALYADRFAASGVVAGLFGTAYAAVRLVVVLPLGRRIDLGNSKRWLLVGLGLNVLLLVGFTLVESIEHVVVLRGLQALGATVLWVTGAAVVGEIAPDGDRGLWIGTYNQARSVGSLGGDLLGGALLFLYGFGTTYAVLIGLTLVATAAVVAFVRDDPGTRSDPAAATGLETFGRLLGRRAVLALVVFRFGFSFGKMAVVIFLPIYARTEFGMTALLIGGILAGGKLTKGVAQGYVGEYADQVGSLERFVLAGTAGYALGTALIPVAGTAAGWLPGVTFPGPWGAVRLMPAFFVLFVAYAVLGVADSLRIPTSMSLFVAEGEYFDAVAGSLSLRSVAWQVGSIVGPLAVGGVLDYVSFAAGFWLAAGFMVVAGAVFVALFEAEPPPAVADAAPLDD